MSLPEVTALENTCVLETPSAVLNAAFRYAKDNVARCIRWYTLGWAMAAAPHRDAVVVGGETAWNCLGADYVAPWFAPAALALFRERQRPDGQIVAFVDMESGRAGGHGEGAASRTALYVRAVVERYRHYPSPFFREAFQGSVRRAADHLNASVGPDGLIARGGGGDGGPGEGGEASALAALALRLAAEFTGESEYRGAGDALAAAVDERLWDESEGVYLLAGGPGSRTSRHDTGGMVFPLLCGVADAERAGRVLARLARADLQTVRGVRAAPQGPVSPNRTLWYAAAAASYDPRAALDALERIARPVASEAEARDARSNPGEFAEGFDGDTGRSVGMPLSPSVAPTFIWSVLHGLLGLAWANGEPRFAPNWPDGWDEVTIRALPTGNGAIDVTLRRGEEYRAPGEADGDGDGGDADGGWAGGDA